VTIPQLVTPDEPAALKAFFMGSGHNRLLLYTDAGRAWVRALGTWDPMPWHVDQAYRHAAQHAFWGEGNVERLSMLHQLAKRIA
jgi:hypothetical protein